MYCYSSHTHKEGNLMQKTSILIVDDEKSIRVSLESILKGKNYKVKTAIPLSSGIDSNFLRVPEVSDYGIA